MRLGVEPAQLSERASRSFRCAVYAQVLILRDVLVPKPMPTFNKHALARANGHRFRQAAMSRPIGILIWTHPSFPDSTGCQVPDYGTASVEDGPPSSTRIRSLSVTDWLNLSRTPTPFAPSSGMNTAPSSSRVA